MEAVRGVAMATVPPTTTNALTVHTKFRFCPKFRENGFSKILLNMSFTVVDHVVNSHDLHVPGSRSKGDLFKKKCLSGM